MIYGMQSAKDVKLSNVLRALHERIALSKTENRLSRNLSGEDLTDMLNGRSSWLGSGCVHRDTVLPVDLSDVRKKYARKMNHMGRVRDGSEGELSEGYWLCAVLGSEVGGTRLVPLYGEPYSHVSPDSESVSTQLLKAIDGVSAVADRIPHVLSGGPYRLHALASRSGPIQKRFAFDLPPS